MDGVIAKVIPTSLGGALDESTLNPYQKKLLEQQKAQMGMKKGGKVSSASKRADGCAIRGTTRA